MKILLKQLTKIQNLGWRKEFYRWFENNLLPLDTKNIYLPQAYFPVFVFFLHV